MTSEEEEAQGPPLRATAGGSLGADTDSDVSATVGRHAAANTPLSEQNGFAMVLDTPELVFDTPTLSGVVAGSESAA